ncbi:MAG: peptide chain release factor 2 [Acidimicrobiales bacterium]
MRDLTDELKALRRRLDEAEGYLKIAELRSRQPQLETEASRPDLWDDADAARQVTTELTALNDDLAIFDSLTEQVEEVETLQEMAREEGDDSLDSEIDALLATLDDRFAELELRSLFSGEHDERDALCEIHSGAGGTDSQDWANMMLRMYLRWAERRGFAVELDEVQPGQEAGITTASFIVKGRYAYGLLQAERGVHRLVRISPFDSAARRHTAFASFSVVPFLDQGEIAIEIDEKDLRVDTFRSSGAGGQHVNVTDSAVRLTHIPTGLVTSCQNERSQHQNKDRAMQMMAAKLADLEREKREAELAAIAGEQREVGWGSQIRSYVLHPYQMVKDLRTEFEVGNVEGVLDGEVGTFMEAYLRWRRAEADSE